MAVRRPPPSPTASSPVSPHCHPSFSSSHPGDELVLFCFMFISLSEHTVKPPYICRVDLLGSSVWNIKCKDGPRKVKIFRGMCRTMVDGAEGLLLSQVNAIHAEPSRSPLLNKVLSWSLMCSVNYCITWEHPCGAGCSRCSWPSWWLCLRVCNQCQPFICLKCPLQGVNWFKEEYILKCQEQTSLVIMIFPIFLLCEGCCGYRHCGQARGGVAVF